MNLRDDAQKIIGAAIQAALPEEAVKKALEHYEFSDGRLILVSIGKAGWSMASSACDLLKDRIDDGIVITKYEHSKGELPHLRIYEAGHPVPDQNSYIATEKAIKLISELTADDTVLFLISGGGSALFEKPLISPDMLHNITEQLLHSGASIIEMNTIRKRLSAVKGGRFAKLCEPAHVYSIVLSDIIGDPLDMIASGPAYPDSSTTEAAKEILDHYGIELPSEVLEVLEEETPTSLSNVTTVVTGSVRWLCEAARQTCEALGYETHVLTSCLACEAKDAGSFLGAIAKHHANTTKSLAYIAGGETVVHVRGNGLGGRNQELALSAAVELSTLNNSAIFSIGSDGTDGPTDAAGGYVDQDSLAKLTSKGISLMKELENNNSYYALNECDGLIVTGPTGTNVNDVSVLLIKR